MRKIKTGDEVVVITGKDRGRRGKVLSISEKTTYGNKSRGLWVFVEGINLVKKHKKPNPQANQPGGIISKEMPLHISNVALFNRETSKPSKVGIKILDDGKKVRYFKATGEVVDV